jgi:hypothetical protein
MFGCCSPHARFVNLPRHERPLHEWTFKFCASIWTDCWFGSSVHKLARWTKASSHLKVEQLLQMEACPCKHKTEANWCSAG